MFLITITFVKSVTKTLKVVTRKINFRLLIFLLIIFLILMNDNISKRGHNGKELHFRNHNEIVWNTKTLVKERLKDRSTFLSLILKHLILFILLLFSFDAMDFVADSTIFYLEVILFSLTTHFRNTCKNGSINNMPLVFL